MTSALLSVPAFKVTPITSHTYAANLDDSWCIGSVPHGGYVTSLFLCVSRSHFSTTLPHLRQPDPITLNLQFLRRTSEGPAIFTVTDTKLGARTSVIHVSLSQTAEDGKAREEVVGYITHSDISAETGMTLNTKFYLPLSLSPAPPPADLPRLLKDGADEHWQLTENNAFPKFRKATQHAMFYLPKEGQLMWSIVDEWLRFQPHGKPTGWTNESLGFLIDMFPQIVDAWYTGNDKQPSDAPPSLDIMKRDAGGRTPIGRFWFPTLSLNLEIKKRLPAEGLTWLFQRVRAKAIKDGRMDYEVVVGDERGEVVAVVAHTSLVMEVGRNIGGRGAKKSGEKEESKL